MKAAEVLVEELQARGVPFIATLNGHGLDPLLLACRQAGMRMIDESPRDGAHGMRIAFCHPSSTNGVLTELCEPR